jgi:hypothetical protein
MITWILSIIMLIWVMVKRVGKDGKLEEYPLGLPHGTIRAIITIMIVAFPFNYILTGHEIPGIITNSIFILIAFYFEARKSETHPLDVIKEIKDPLKVAEERKKDVKPLYLPKYSIRISLVFLLISIILGNYFGPNIPFQTVNTLLDILTIILLYFIGSFFRSIGNKRRTNKLKNQIKAIPNYQSLSKYEILDKIQEKKPGFWVKTWRNGISLITFISVTLALIAYTFDWDFTFTILSIYNLSLREALLLLITVYYGFRD